MQIKFYATLRDLLGTDGIDYALDRPASIREVLLGLTAAYPALGPKLWGEDDKLGTQVTVLLNGRAVQYLKGLETTVKPADKLALFPPIGGG